MRRFLSNYFDLLLLLLSICVVFILALLLSPWVVNKGKEYNHYAFRWHWQKGGGSWKWSVAYPVVQCDSWRTCRSIFHRTSSSCVALAASDDTTTPCLRTDSRQELECHARRRTWRSTSARRWRHSSHACLSVSSTWRHGRHRDSLSITHITSVFTAIGAMDNSTVLQRTFWGRSGAMVVSVHQHRNFTERSFSLKEKTYGTPLGSAARWHRRQTNKQTGRQTDRWTALLRKVPTLRRALTLYEHIKTAQQRIVIQQYGNWYTGRWWVGCYIWYSEEEPGKAGTIIASRL